MNLSEYVGSLSGVIDFLSESSGASVEFAAASVGF
jgi:hypothetical protein